MTVIVLSLSGVICIVGVIVNALLIQGNLIVIIIVKSLDSRLWEACAPKRMNVQRNSEGGGEVICDLKNPTADFLTYQGLYLTKIKF